MQYYCIKQYDITDFGAACLATISKQCGLSTSIPLLSTLHKRGTKTTSLSTQFYGRKKIMKKSFKNILVKTGKRNGIILLICAVILTASLGTLLGCKLVKGNTEAASKQTESEDIQAKDPQTEDTQAENTQPDESSLQSNSDAANTEQSIHYSSFTVGDITISLYEDKQDITAKLNEAGLSYHEINSDLIYGEDSEDNKYDTYYAIEKSWCIYFKDGICVRLLLRNEELQMVRGIHINDSASQLIEKYGDSFEKHMYNAHGVYSVYRYTFDDCIYEFMIEEEYQEKIWSVDIFVPSLYPIYYNYGDELTDSEIEEWNQSRLNEE